MRSCMLLKLMHSAVKQLGGIVNGIREQLGVGHVWAGGRATSIPSSLQSAIVFVPLRQAVQREMENRRSSSHLITGNSSHCAEEIAAAYDCLLPIHVAVMAQWETVC